ncbi:MAG TPA: arylesterase [Burkholderiaceae bacterium]|nr:arylesterase [Burkholderiaceae bacterium]
MLIAVGSAAGQAASPTRTVLVVGDSLSAEFGLPRDTGWVSRLSERLARQERQYSVVNASISGDTTSGGRARLPRLLQTVEPDIVVIELGGNDGLRGLDLEQMRDNLQAMIEACRAAHARVLLVGVRIPPNYGRDYSERFFQTFASLAARNRVELVPFLMDGFADRLELFQADRIHPNQQAQERMLDNVLTRLLPMLRRPAA